MAYIVLEASVRTHPKFLAAGPEASWLWVCGLGYCQDGLTDGFIPETAIEFLGVKRPRHLALKLVSVKLWEVVKGGWQMHDYFDHNKPADEVRRVMRARKEGGKLGGRPRKNLEGSTESNLEGLDVRDESENLPENPLLPVLPVLPVLPSTSTEERSLEPSETVLVYPTVGKGGSVWELTEEQLGEWSTLYPGLDVLAEMRKALAWLTANPSRRKTARGMPRCLVNWLTRSTDHGRGGSAVAQERPFTNYELEKARSWRRSVGYCPHDPPCTNATNCMARYIRERLRLAQDAVSA